MKFSVAFPELGPQQIKMLERLILECVPEKESYANSLTHVTTASGKEVSGTGHEMNGYNRAIDETTKNLGRLFDE